MRRSATRIPRILACAAVPVMLVVAGCSSSSSDDAKGGSGGSGGSSAPSAPATPTMAPARFSSLPDSCKTLSGSTIDKLVPKAKKKAGTAGESSDVEARANCSWNGLKYLDDGAKGAQYRWLDVALSRYDSVESVGSGDQQAQTHYTETVEDTEKTSGAKGLKTAPAPGVGDQATLITYTLHNSDADFSYATVVATQDNVVLTLTYNGAGYAGAKSPSVSDISKDALAAAGEAVGAIVDGGTGSGASGTSGGAGSAPSKSAAHASGKPSSSAKPSASPSGSSAGKPSSGKSPSPKPSASSSAAGSGAGGGLEG